MAKPRPSAREFTFAWEGVDRKGREASGEIRATGVSLARVTLRRQGFVVKRIRRQAPLKRKQKITEKDIVVFTRQLATMLKAGVPMLQAFDIVGKGHNNPSVQKLMADLKGLIESGTSLSNAFMSYPLYFDALYCNLIAAGEQAGILDTILDRLATYREKILGIKSKIKSAMVYPIAVIVVAVVITTVIMLFVVPTFKDLFKSVGSDLPYPTLVVIAISDFFVRFWWLLFGGAGIGLWLFMRAWKTSAKVQHFMDRTLLKLPIFGIIIRKAVIARWTRTLSTMFAAGVPMVEALDSVSGAAGNLVYYDATRRIQTEVSTGGSLSAAMAKTGVFPNMVLQMTTIGEESGALDEMLGKASDFFEREVDDAVEALSSLMEPVIMVVLGTLIGGLVIAMYLPIFKMGNAVG